MNLRHSLLAAALAACFVPGVSQADISDGVLRVGILTDFSSIYADYAGDSKVTAYQMAIDDFGGNVNGKKIELIKADFQNKADVSMALARKWIDEDKVDLIVDTPNSGVAAAVSRFVAEKNKVLLFGAVSSDLTGKFCTPNSLTFYTDTYAFAAVAGATLVKMGFKTWFSITADYAMGHAMEADTSAIVKAGGGSMIGTVRHPFGATDMSSFVLQAQASKAQVMSVASAGNDATTIERTAVEYGLNKSMQIVALNTELLDAYRNRKVLDGMYFTEGWYWDQTPETRAWAKRYVEKHPKHYYPSRTDAASYSMMTHYLTAVKALNDDTDGKAIVDKMKATPVNDMYAKNGVLRGDGRLIKEMYLAQVKPAAEIKQDWDLYRIVATVPGETAFRPVAQSECPLLKK